MELFSSRLSPWSGIARGTLVAVALLLFIAQLSTAIGLSFDAEPPRAAAVLVDALALVALFLGGWVSTHGAEETSSPGFAGIAVWGLTFLAVLHLAVIGYEIPGFGVAAGDEGMETLLPFSRYEAWLHVAENVATLAAAFSGAWTGAHVGVRRPQLRFAPV